MDRHKLFNGVYMKQDQAEKIIKTELARLGSISGGVGGLAGGFVGSAAGAVGGGLGAAWAQQFLPTESVTRILGAARQPEEVLGAVLTVFRKLGKILDNQEEENRGPCLFAVVGSGFFRLNPTAVSLEIVDVAESETIVRLSAHAKEGLIKQKSAPKAIARIMDALNVELGVLREIEESLSDDKE